jgi:hypothetical protein
VFFASFGAITMHPSLALFLEVSIGYRRRSTTKELMVPQRASSAECHPFQTDELFRAGFPPVGT